MQESEDGEHDSTQQSFGDNNMKRGGLKKIDGYLGGLGIHASFDFLSLIRRWDLVVGKQSAQMTIPLKMKGKTLIVLTTHSIHSQNLSYMHEDIIKKIASIFPRLKGKINRMGFQNNESFFRIKKEEWALRLKGQKDSPPPHRLHPQSPEYKKLKREGEDMAKVLSDQKLRNLVVSLYIQLETSRILE